MIVLLASASIGSRFNPSESGFIAISESDCGRELFKRASNQSHIPIEWLIDHEKFRRVNFASDTNHLVKIAFEVSVDAGFDF